jgi:hypothetical protein
MDKTIYTSTCPGCGAQMPTPPRELWEARYHPCPSCPPISGRARRWRAARTDDKDGNIHFGYSDSRNGTGELTAQLRMRVTPAMKVALDRMGDEWARRVLELAIDNS